MSCCTLNISATKRRRMILNAFCPTGEGGGVDPSCSPGLGISSGDDGNYTEAQEKFFAAYDEWGDTIPEDQQRAMQHYSRRGDRVMNGVLRGHYDLQEKLSGSDARHFLNVEKNIARIDAAIDSAPRTSVAITLHRGINADLKFGSGDTVHDKGYMSTSANKDIAGNFGKTRLSIHVPKGSKVMPISYATESGEEEWLLPRGSTLEVMRVEGDTIHARLKQ